MGNCLSEYIRFKIARENIRDYGFGNNVKLVGIPMVTLTYPTSDLIFCALQQEEKFWDFLESTKDDRHLLPDDLVGVIISALLTR